MLAKFLKFVKNSSLFLAIIPVLFLIFGIATISDYGMNWDSAFHFNRGQDYFWYFLTGKKNFDDTDPFKNTNCTLGNLNLFLQKDCRKVSPKRSFYQDDRFNFEYFIKNDSGHPPLSDIFSAFTNYIFYQKLGVLGDTASYHIFIILASFALILAVSFFVAREFGFFPAIVSSLVLASYPLFFSESHFNIKDPPEAAFFGIALIFFYLGIVENNWKFIITSAVSAGLALGTKLNIAFAPLIIIPWLIYYLKQELYPKFSRKKLLSFFAVRKASVISLILYLPITLGLVYILWPFLWQDPLRNTFKILDYYSQIGIGTPSDMANFVFKGWNLYPIVWIAITTTIPVLIISSIGLIFAKFSKRYDKSLPALFIVLWFLVPVLRVSWPKADIYGGIRQIMEFVPALAILSGMGAYWLLKLRFRKLIYILVVAGLLFSVFEMIRIHPNENIYFNQIIGGLPGASKANIPYWGNTYGSVYLEGIKWINRNAEVGSKVALPVGVLSIPRLMFRPDLEYTKPYWSGLNRNGEYGIEMNFEWPPKYWYSFQYYDQYLNPSYVYSVEGIPILKVWKNDLAHTKDGFKEESVYIPKSIIFEKNTLNPQIKIDMGKDINLTRLSIKHENTSCQKQIAGYIATSSDEKNFWREPEPIDSPQWMPGVSNAFGWSDKNFVYFFAGKKVRYIIVDPQMQGSCYLDKPVIEVRGIKKVL